MHKNPIHAIFPFILWSSSSLISLSIFLLKYILLNTVYMTYNIQLIFKSRLLYLKDKTLSRRVTLSFILLVSDCLKPFPRPFFRYVGVSPKFATIGLNFQFGVLILYHTNTAIRMII